MATTIIACKHCGWFVTDPSADTGDLRKCDNCGKKFVDTNSEVEEIIKTENNKYITKTGKEI